MSPIVTLRANVIAVGGRYAELRLPELGTDLELAMNDEQHQALGKFLYQEVEIVVRTPVFVPPAAEQVMKLARFLCESGTRTIAWDDARVDIQAEYARVAEIVIGLGADPRRLP